MNIETAMWKRFLEFMAHHGHKLEGLSQKEVLELFEKYKRETGH